MSQHLLHIGYPKAGSTFLQEWFGRHPAFRYTPGGVNGFRDVFQIASSSATEHAYHVTSSEELSLPQDASGYVYAPGGESSRPVRIQENQARVCELLRSLYPAARILIVTRGFRGMILSSYSQYVRRGGTDTLGEMCAKLAASLATEGGHYFDYDYLIGLYARAFGEDKLIVLPYEILRDDQRRFTALLEERLGVEHAEVGLGRVNASLSPEELYWYPRVSRFVFDAAAPLGRARAERLHRAYVNGRWYRRLLPLIRSSGRRFTPDAFPNEILQHFEGKATRLRPDPLYSPYAADYLF